MPMLVAGSSHQAVFIAMSGRGDRCRSAGFTLLEILLVLSIMAIAAAIVAPSFFSSAAYAPKDEGQRLVQLLRMVGDESTLSGEAHRLLLFQHGYKVQKQDDMGQWHTLDDDTFAPYHFASGIILQSLLPEKILPDDVQELRLGDEVVKGVLLFGMTGRGVLADLRFSDADGNEVLHIVLRPGPGGIYLDGKKS